MVAEHWRVGERAVLEVAGSLIHMLATVDKNEHLVHVCKGLERLHRCLGSNRL